MIEIPLTSDSSQLFSSVINEVRYDFRVYFNFRNTLWNMDISSSGVSILYGVALLGGVDIFKQYNIPIENVYVVNSVNTDNATSVNLGTDVKLYILTEEEINNV